MVEIGRRLTSTKLDIKQPFTEHWHATCGQLQLLRGNPKMKDALARVCVDVGCAGGQP